MLDLVWTGGITEAVKIAALADTYHLAVTPHDCTGPVNVFAALHLCAAAQNAMIQETVRGFYEGYYLDMLTRPLPIREGRATFDLGPGLGVSYARMCCPGPTCAGESPPHRRASSETRVANDMFRKPDRGTVDSL